VREGARVSRALCRDVHVGYGILFGAVAVYIYSTRSRGLLARYSVRRGSCVHL
jgi:hypothetical protein